MADAKTVVRRKGGSLVDEGRGAYCAQLATAATLPLLGEYVLRHWVDPLLVLRPQFALVGLAVVVLATAVSLWLRRWLSRPASLAVAFGSAGSIPVAAAALDILFTLATPTGAVQKLLVGGIAVACAGVFGLVAGYVLARFFRYAWFRWMPALVIAALLLPQLATWKRSQVPAPRGTSGHPDVILIVLDTTRPDHLSIYGYPRDTTPFLDQFDDEALVYDNAWSPAPWTPPAHASLFTGLLPAEHGCEGGGFNPPVSSLAEILRGNGYVTLGIVNNPLLVGSFGWSRGFDTYRRISGLPGLSLAYPSWLLPRLLSEDARFTGDSRLTFEMTRRWWARSGSQPRFVMINLLDPHSPYGSAGVDRFLKERTRSAKDITNDSEEYDAGLARATGTELERVVALYDGDVAYMDQQLGRFFQWLQGRQELDQAIIVVTADHGERLGERGLLGHQLGLDEVLLRVPLLVRYPPRIPAGRTSKLVQSHGILATVLSLAGVRAPSDGVTRSPSLSDQDNQVVVAQMRHQGWYIDQVTKRNVAFDPSPFDGHWHSANDRTWKLVRSSTGSAHLYFLPEDPTEERDVSALNPDVVARLSATLDELPQFDPGPETIEFLKEDEDLLRGLGYVE